MPAAVYTQGFRRHYCFDFTFTSSLLKIPLHALETRLCNAHVHEVLDPLYTFWSFILVDIDVYMRLTASLSGPAALKI